MISDSARATPGQGEGVTNRLRMSTVETAMPMYHGGRDTRQRVLQPEDGLQ